MNPLLALLIYVAGAVLTMRVVVWLGAPAEDGETVGLGLVWPLLWVVCAIMASLYLLGALGGVKHPLRDYRAWRRERLERAEQEADRMLRDAMRGEP